MRFRKHYFETLPSTQTLAQQLCAQQKAEPGDVICATQQTAGYGRRGRAWQSPPGNLYFTLIETLHEKENLSWLGYAMGLGLYDAVKPLLQNEAILQLKWPNDLLLNSAKLSGLLLEVSEDKVLIGVGLNVQHGPETDQNTATLNVHTRTKQTPRHLLDAILTRYDRWHGIGLNHGFEGMRQAWLEKAAFKGETITARLGNGLVLQGIFNNLDPRGALALQTEQGEKMITAADIYLTGTP